MNKREQIRDLVSQGKTTKEIAKLLNISTFTVRYYREDSKYASRRIINDRIAEHRRKVKRKALAYSGLKCLKCDYNKCSDGLTFHHLDPNAKEYQIANGKSVSWEVMKEEIDKTILLCCRCHAELHADLWVPNKAMIAHQGWIRKNYIDKPILFYKDKIEGSEGQRAEADLH